MALFRDDRELSADPRDRSRSHLALSRLIPLLRPRRPSRDTVEERYYALTPGQNHLEIWTSSSLYYVTWILLLCGAIWHLGPFHVLAWPLIVVFCAPVVPVLIVAIMAIAEPFARAVSRKTDRIEPSLIHSLFQQGILFALALEASFDSHWVMWVGRVWIALVLLELTARLVERLVLRKESEPSAS